MAAPSVNSLDGNFAPSNVLSCAFGYPPLVLTQLRNFAPLIVLSSVASKVGTNEPMSNGIAAAHATPGLRLFERTDVSYVKLLPSTHPTLCFSVGVVRYP